VKRVNWKWLLPIVQLALALACHVYDPHLYRVIAERDGAVDNPEYVFQHVPALAGRVSQGLNFPALVLNYPIRNVDGVIFKHNSDYTLIWISTTDVGFFLGIVLFWFWVGMRLDEGLGRRRKRDWPSKARVVGLGCGVLFSLLTGAYAVQMIGGKWRPFRQIGMFGMVWAVALCAYFVWRLTRTVREPRSEAP
jgi:hypothetical protein